jgi:hypothetical protein
MSRGDIYHSIPSSYCGHDALQWFAEFVLWERLLNLHRELEAIVELGTGGGAFSLYLSHQATARDLEFVTYDKVRHPGPAVPGAVIADVLAEPQRVFPLLTRPLVLHCDDGDKPREMATFASALLPGSLLVVHDWGTEAHQADVPDCLEPVHAELWEDESMSAVFRRRP